MKYELAQQLKDAGFPQKGWGLWWNWVVSSSVNPGEQFATRDDHWMLSPGHWESADATYCYAPTLEELIEACGDRLGRVAQWENGWSAVTPFGPDMHDVMGETAEEAVARLWLALKDDKRSEAA